MTLYKNTYRIESTRLKNHNYSSNGGYFVTICTNNRQHFFGEIENFKINTMQADIAIKCWNDLPNHYSNCVLDEFVVMPNHIHGIIIIDNSTIVVETGFKPVSTNVATEIGLKPVSTRRHSISEIVRGFKTFTARKINEAQNMQGRQF